MEVFFKKTFLKDIQRLPSTIQSQIHPIIFVEAPNAKNLYDIHNVKKLVGSTSYFRIRVGVYRIGFTVEGDRVIFMRVLHRKEMYQYFP